MKELVKSTFIVFIFSAASLIYMKFFGDVDHVFYEAVSYKVFIFYFLLMIFILTYKLYKKYF